MDTFFNVRAATFVAFMAMTALVSADAATLLDGADNKATARNPITVYTRDAIAKAPGGLADQLRQRARAQGKVRVIVGLRMTMRMEDTLSAAQELAQRRALQSAQSGVAARVLGAASAQRGDRFTFIPYMSMFVNPAELDRLLADPQVESVQEDRPSPPALADSAPLVHAPELWEKRINGSNQVIAVLDTGVAKSHPMLAGAVVSEACYSTTDEEADSRSLCPGGVDASTAAGSGVNCPVALASCDHGTHVAGIAAGNSATLDGIARNAGVIAIKVFSRLTDSDPDRVGSWDTDQIKGLQRVFALRRDFRIAAVNISIAIDEYAEECDLFFPALEAAITKLRNVGIGTIVASGNEGLYGAIAKPACISTAIAVGNTRKDDRLYGGRNSDREGGSNYSDLIRLLAPGTGIKSAVPGNKYDVKTGTSMAAPHVAGAFALLRQAKPSATIDEMVEALRCSGKPVNRMFVPGEGPDSGEFKLDPYRRRIDLLGAYFAVKNAPNAVRTWSFDSEAEALDWAPRSGTWKVQSGNYLPTSRGIKGVATQASSCHTKVRVIARLKRQGTKTTGEYLESGIVVRTQGSFNEPFIGGYVAVYLSCQANSAGHCDDDATGAPGLALFYRINQQKASDGFPARNTLCRKKRAVNVNGYNTIKVISNGASHSYYLNGNLVCSVNDDTWIDGNVMLYGGPANLTTRPLKFDSVSIEAVGANDPAPPFQGVAAAN